MGFLFCLLSNEEPPASPLLFEMPKAHWIKHIAHDTCAIQKGEAQK
jgi:hypothetical protein